jgi:hypothetical protein
MKFQELFVTCDHFRSFQILTLSEIFLFFPGNWKLVQTIARKFETSFKFHDMFDRVEL